MGISMMGLGSAQMRVGAGALLVTIGVHHRTGSKFKCAVQKLSQVLGSEPSSGLPPSHFIHDDFMLEGMHDLKANHTLMISCTT